MALIDDLHFIAIQSKFGKYALDVGSPRAYIHLSS
jgi:hypothetical protein